MKNCMQKYGCQNDDVRFEMDDWALVVPACGEPGLDCVHGCHRLDKLGIPIQWSYTIPGDPHCPGCDAIMPDEMQGLLQMANADYVARFPLRWMEQDLNRTISAAYAEFQKTFLRGSGVKPKEKA